MQYGFTRGKSPSMASLLLTEAICENLDARQPTYVAALDAQKAFDVVYQNSLLRRIYMQGGHKHWRYYAASIRGTKIRVRIDGELSSTVCISQGVGQERVPSTGNYKIFIDPVLRLLSDMNAGQFIGPYFCGCPTCADDILLVAESPDELQAQLDVVFAFSTQERYRIHPQKSKIIITGDTNPETTSSRWYLGDEPLEITDNCTHLGLERATSQLTPHSLISDRIQLARRTAYSLTGAGFHGNTGISPSVCRRMISTYIIPSATPELLRPCCKQRSTPTYWHATSCCSAAHQNAYVPRRHHAQRGFSPETDRYPPTCDQGLQIKVMVPIVCTPTV